MINNQDSDEPQEERKATDDDEQKQEGNWGEVRSSIDKAVRRTSSLARTKWKARVSALTTARAWPALALVFGYLVISRADPAAAQSTSNQNAPRTAGQSPSPERQAESPLSELFGLQTSTA